MSDVTSRLESALAGRYRIVRELGAGAAATVYLAEDLKHGRRVAIKVLRPELAAIIGAERFLAEIHTTAQLQHPNILALHDSGEADGLLFYVTPFVEGESLRARMRRERRVAVDDALSIAAEVADALEHAHRRGVVHRDIKPENILIQDGRALVADFGIALTLGEVDARRLTETGLSIGTPGYMSPEQALGERTLDARSDVFSLGVVLYEMVTGVRPFEGPTAQAIVGNTLTERPVPPSRRHRDVPRELDAPILRALDKDRDRRTQSAEALKASFPASARSSGRHPLASRRTWVAAGVALVTIAGIAGVVALANRRRVGPPGTSRAAPDTAAVRLVKVADYWIALRTQQGCDQAITRYAEATRHDTSFVAAWAGLANADAICAMFGNADPYNGLVAAKAAAEHTLALDSGSAAAWTALGMSALFSEQEWEAARADFERASALDPSTPWPWLYRTWTFLAVDQIDSAEASIRRAYQRAPTANLIGARLASILAHREKYAEAERVIADVLQRDSNDIPARYTIVEIALRRNRCSDALVGADWLVSHQALEPREAASAYRMNGAIVAAAWARCGRVTEARRYADSVAAREAGGAYVDPWSLAMVYAALGDSARMFTELETAVRDHDGGLFFLPTDALLAPYRDAPHFRDLMRRLHEL